MGNNLSKMEENLRSIAKRYKSVKYSIGLAILFLMLGGGAFSQEINDENITTNTIPTREQITSSRKNLRNSLGSLQSKIEETKSENERSLTGLRLELIQLMEQGNQVVKSPWSSWQFGLNYMYNNWRGIYKGRGDKKEKYPFEGVFTRSNDIFERSISPYSDHYGELENSTDSTSASSNRRRGLRWQYGITGITQEQEKPGVLNILASIKPKDVSIGAVEAPKMTIETPQAPNLNLPKLDLPKAEIPEPRIQNVKVDLPEPNTNPFAEYVFDRGTSGYFRDWRSWYKAENPDPAGPKWEIRPNQDGKGDVYWAGYDPKTQTYKQGAGIYGEGLTEGAANPLSTDPKRNYENKGTNNTDSDGKNWVYELDTINSGKRPGVMLYLNDSTDRKDKNNFPKRGFYLTNTTLHLAGDVNGAGLSGGTVKPGATEKRVRGQIGIHTVSDGELENITAYLYGKAAFHSIETWHTGKTKYTNVTVNIKGEDNSVFLIYPSTYDNLLWHTGRTAKNSGKEALNGPYNRRGGFEGKVSVNMDAKSKRNIIYNQLGVQGAFDIVNEGEYKLKGQGNMVYSGLGYSPDFENMRGKTYSNKQGSVEIGYTKPDSAHYNEERSKNLTPKIEIKKSVSMIGDNNIGLFFSEKRPVGSKAGETDVVPYPLSKPATDKEWEKSVVGIYQGQIQFKANVGFEKQEVDENSGDKNYTEGNVGIFARSGQREGIIPSKDLGAPKNWDKVNDKYTNESVYDHDKIHSLHINKLEVFFGKYSKRNIMLAAENGTVVDVAKDENKKNRIKVMDGAIKDYDSTKVGEGKISADDSVNEAGSGTIIAYSNGVWQNSVHKMSAETAGKLEGKSTEINIGRDVEMTGRYLKTGVDAKGNETGISSIAFLAKDGGSVNMLKNTTAYGFGSIIAYAEGKKGNTHSKVTVNGTITAKDGWAAKDAATKPYLYRNIGALAKKDGKIELKGKVDIYGIGAIADGENAEVTFRGTDHRIRTGKDGGLVALNKGKIEFSGGTIEHSANDDKGKDHDEATPFYADSNSKINFTGKTTIEMGNGILMEGNEADYSKDSGTATKYNGMKNVTVKLVKDGVVLGVKKGKTLDWTGTSSGLDMIKEEMKLDKIDKNGKKYKLYYVNGNFNLKTNLDLGDPNNEYYNLGLANEVFTIESGRRVFSNNGKGLEMGSLSTATSNTTNKYINEGEVSITGGDDTSRALSISYGTIHNKNLISVEKGIGAYGINGSKILNDTNANINITGADKGIGILGYASGEHLDKYGTDKKITDGTLTAADKLLEIENKGNITVAGKEGIGIYAELNNPSGSPLITRANGLVKNSGKITALGDKGIGIFSKRNKVELSGSGNSDITVGKKGIGVFADDSEVSLLSNYGIEVKDEGTGIFVKDGSQVSAGNLKLTYTGAKDKSAVGMFYDDDSNNIKTNDTNIELDDKSGTTEGLIALYVKKKSGAGKLVNTADIKGDKGYGIVTEGSEVDNTGNITFNNVISKDRPSVGMFSREHSGSSGNMRNSGTITMGASSVGMYGHGIKNAGKITVGDKGTAIYSMGGNVDLEANSEIVVGKNNAIGTYIGGTAQNVTANANSKFTLGDGSFAFVNMGSGNIINSNITTQNLGNETVYIYSKDKAGTVNNNTVLNSTGNYNYGIYSAGTVNNTGNINFGTGKGNVGIYSTYGGTATNSGEITVGASHIDTDKKKDRYAIGMAAGFTPNKEELAQGKTAYTGNIKNEGTINVTGTHSIGMYGTGKGTTVYNGTSKGSTATINLKANNTTGMYLDNEAYGYNYGTIKSVGSGLQALTGVVVKNGATFENHGLVELNAEAALGGLIANDEDKAPGVIKNYGTFKINGKVNTESPEVTDEDIVRKQVDKSDLSKRLKNGTEIVVPTDPNTEAIQKDGKPIKPPKMDIVDDTTKRTIQKKMLTSSKIGMYIDTSSKNYTKPLEGLGNLGRLKTADLIIGNEATQNTTKKYITITDKKILEPYSEMIKRNTQISEWHVYSNSLTWYASLDKTGSKLNALYLAKESYTAWAGKVPWPVDKKDTYNFTDGLEQRYGVEDIGTRENAVFQKLNGIGKNEEILLYQAFDEMMGHQYANVQQRINATGEILSQEFDYLRSEWQTVSKDSNKVKVFGTNGEYKTDTAGVIDYKNYAYGVAYVHEDETVRLGKTLGWYTGIVHNTFKFKDIGRSKEQMLQAKLGVFKSVPFDYDNSLNWTISGEVFAGYNKMHRRFLVVDEIFHAKSKYYSYGLGVKNEVSKSFRLSEDFSFKPYAALKTEYGRMTKIREKSGEIKLEVKHNDYFSIRPEFGGELAYKHLFDRKTLKVGLTVAYENELGRIANGKNKARVVDTTADWFNIRGEKEDRRGNIKTDLNIGLDNQRYGVTANVGYDTKGHNVRGGLGLRVIF